MRFLPIEPEDELLSETLLFADWLPPFRTILLEGILVDLVANGGTCPPPHDITGTDDCTTPTFDVPNWFACIMAAVGELRCC